MDNLIHDFHSKSFQLQNYFKGKQNTPLIITKTTQFFNYLVQMIECF
jgi:hypothetical protein